MFIENENVEWKERWKDDYLKQICSFANTKGGLLYIGVDDKGKVVGLDDAVNLMNVIPQKIKTFLGINAESILKQKKKLKYIIIKIQKHATPVSYKGKYYLRSGSSTYEASGVDLDRIVLRKIGQRLENLTIESFRKEEISIDAINKFKELALKKGKFKEQELDISNLLLLQKLGLYKNENINYAGILLFGKDPEEYIKGSFIKIALIKDDNITVSKETEITGPLMLQLDKALRILYKQYLRIAGLYNKNENIIISEASMKELLLNSIEHRTYDIFTPIEIRIYKNKITIFNPTYNGNEINIEELYMPHPSMPTNPLIAKTFETCGLATNWGLGLEKVKRNSTKEQVPLPKFKKLSSGLMVRCNPKSAYLKRLRSVLTNYGKDDLLALISNRKDITEEDVRKVLELKQKNY